MYPNCNPRVLGRCPRFHLHMGILNSDDRGSGKKSQGSSFLSTERQKFEIARKGLISSRVCPFSGLENDEQVEEAGSTCKPTLFSSRPPSSRMRPEYGYSRGTVGRSGTSAYLQRKPKPTKAETASENWKRAFRGDTWGISGPHIESTSSYS